MVRDAEYARTHPDDPDLAEVVERVSKARAAYLRWVSPRRGPGESTTSRSLALREAMATASRRCCRLASARVAAPTPGSTRPAPLGPLRRSTPVAQSPPRILEARSSLRVYAMPLSWSLLALANSPAGCADDAASKTTISVVGTTTTASTTVSATTTAPSSTTTTTTTYRREPPRPPQRRSPVPTTRSCTCSTIRVAARHGPDRSLRRCRVNEGSLEGTVRAWLGGLTPSQADLGITTEVPPGTELHGVEVADGVATVDLSSEFADGEGIFSMRARLAQLVYTVTGYDPDITGVRLELDGTPVMAFVFSGVALVLDDPMPGPLDPDPSTGPHLPRRQPRMTRPLSHAPFQRRQRVAGRADRRRRVRPPRKRPRPRSTSRPRSP